MVALTALAALLALAPAESRRSAAEHRPLSFVFVSIPRNGEYPKVRAPEVLSALREVARARTSLDPVELPDASTRSCVRPRAEDNPVRLGCLVQVALTSAQDQAHAAELLLLFVATPDKKNDRLSALMIDVKIAHQILEAYRDDPEAAELALLERAVWSESGTWTAAGARSLRHGVEGLFDQTLKGPLTARGHWQGLGRARIVVSVDRAALTIDGRPLGTLSAGANLVEALWPGARQIELRHPDFLPSTQTLEVQAGATHELRIQLIQRPSATARIFRQTAIWTGAGLCAAGLGILIYSFVKPAQFVLCDEGMDCDAAGPFKTFGSDDQRGVPVAPLGYSLLLTGGVWSLGSWLFASDQRVPWVEALVGLGAGAVAFSGSALAQAL